MEKVRKLSKAKKKEDIAKSVHKVESPLLDDENYYLENNDVRNVLSDNNY